MLTDASIKSVDLRDAKVDLAKKINPHSQISTLIENMKYLNEGCKVSFHFHSDHDSKMFK